MPSHKRPSSARVSLLKRLNPHIVQVYTAEKVQSLLSALQAEAISVLLFLKNVQRIEVHHWAPGSGQPTLMYSCSLADTSDATLTARRYILSLAAGAQSQVGLSF